MPRRNEALKQGTLYCVTKASDGKYFRVYSKGVLDKLLADGFIKPEDRIGLIKSIEF